MTGDPARALGLLEVRDGRRRRGPAPGRFALCMYVHCRGAALRAVTVDLHLTYGINGSLLVLDNGIMICSVVSVGGAPENAGSVSQARGRLMIVGAGSRGRKQQDDAPGGQARACGLMKARTGNAPSYRHVRECVRGGRGNEWRRIVTGWQRRHHQHSLDRVHRA